MTNAQRLEIRASEIRQRLNEIAGLEGDDFTDEIRAESEKLQTEYRDVETKRRAAIVAEGETETETTKETDGDAEARERAELREKVSVVDYIDAAGKGRDVSGAAGEYNAALEIRGDRFPLSLLAPEADAEERATTDTDGRITQGSWVDRLFAMTMARRLGVTFASVSPGQVSYPVVTAGASAAQRGRADAAADAAWTVGATTIEPTRNSVRATFNRTDALRLPGLEDALRRDLRMAMMEGIDRAIFAGDTGATENRADITGLTTAGIGEVTVNQANKVKGDKTLEALAGMVDGIHAGGLGDLNVVAFLGAWRLWETTIANAAAENQTVGQFLRAAGVSFGLRGGIEAATGNGKMGAVVGLARGIRNAAVSAVWEDAALVRDPYSDAASAGVALTMHTFWGFKIPRPANFKRLKFVT